MTKPDANWHVKQINIDETDVDFVLGSKAGEIIIRVPVNMMADTIGRFFGARRQPNVPKMSGAQIANIRTAAIVIGGARKAVEDARNASAPDAARIVAALDAFDRACSYRSEEIALALAFVAALHDSDEADTRAFVSDVHPRGGE